MFKEYPDIVTVEQIAHMLGIGKASAYELLQKNQIQYVRVGKKYIVPKNAVIAFVSGMCYNDSG
jgi:excisionase family DNA binding protein